MEVAISQRQPRHPAVLPVGSGSSTVILIKELMGKVCPSAGTFIRLLKVKPITMGLQIYQSFTISRQAASRSSPTNSDGFPLAPRGLGEVAGAGAD